MIKFFSVTALLLFFCTQSFATELTPSNLIGRYKVTAKAGFQTVYLKFRVVDTREFEIQRTYSDGHDDELCNGTYNLHNSLYLDEYLVLNSGKSFDGLFTCPSDRSKKIDFNIDFANTTVEDLAKGTTVTVTTSLAPIRLNAYVKKQ
ncbi:MAG TPA: hypothetical protein VN132_15640 [Bdellovibrio sp.]|nr:hypothetical protein [Bdellovibrio sp.]